LIDHCLVDVVVVKTNPVNQMNYGQIHGYEWWDDVFFCMIVSL
jgi:hypothetical protein